MSEIFKNTSQVVTLDITGGAVADETPTATLTRGGTDYPLTVEEDVDAGTQTLQRWGTRIGIEHTQEEEEFKIVWDFTIDDVSAQKTDWFEVIKPYVPLGDARWELGLGADVSDENIIRAERKARYMINRYCGQKFGLTHETLIAKGSGTKNISLPKPLLRVTSIKRHKMPDVTLESTMYEVRREGLVLRRTYGNEAAGTGVTVVNPIFNPYYDVKSDTFAGAGPVFHKNVEWLIEGDWGYDVVPNVVREAALMLMEQYLCNEEVYRERYVTSMASADFRYAMSPAAFRSTGNAVVDYILQDFVWDNIWLV